MVSSSRFLRTEEDVVSTKTHVEALDILETPLTSDMDLEVKDCFQVSFLSQERRNRRREREGDRLTSG